MNEEIFWEEFLECYHPEKTWRFLIEREATKLYFREMIEIMKDDRRKRYKSVQPHEDEVFSWTFHCSISDVKVVILGQDPYPNPYHAHGLAFSSLVEIPRNLKNIYKELNKEGFQTPFHGNLTGWADQGVLLLNSILTRCTVDGDDGNMHDGIGWQKFTSAVIEWISHNLDGVVFLLWGEEAKKKSRLIMQGRRRQHILTATLPDNRCASREYETCHHFSTELERYQLLQEHPFGRCKGFFGCNHFLKTNLILVSEGKQSIYWSDLPPV